ncbi:MAG: hypothetical protein IH868_10990 [Chloroflexi bacterium]|nr:hypothetical protein [Chloroflexota bacterium]
MERPSNSGISPARRTSLLAQEGIDLDSLTILERRRYERWIETGFWGPGDD